MYQRTFLENFQFLRQVTWPVTSSVTWLTDRCEKYVFLNSSQTYMHDILLERLLNISTKWAHNDPIHRTWLSPMGAKFYMGSYSKGRRLNTHYWNRKLYQFYKPWIQIMIIYHRWNLKNWRIVWKTRFKNYREKAELEARVFWQLLIHLVLLPDAAALDIGWLEEEDERCF